MGGDEAGTAEKCCRRSPRKRVPARGRGAYLRYDEDVCRRDRRYVAECKAFLICFRHGTNTTTGAVKRRGHCTQRTENREQINGRPPSYTLSHGISPRTILPKMVSPLASLGGATPVSCRTPYVTHASFRIRVSESSTRTPQDVSEGGSRVRERRCCQEWAPDRPRCQTGECIFRAAAARLPLCVSCGHAPPACYLQVCCLLPTRSPAGAHTRRCVYEGADGGPPRRRAARARPGRHD